MEKGNGRGKRQKPTSSSGGTQQAASISKEAYDDILLSNATHKAQIETLQEQVRELTESFTEQIERTKAELAVAKEVIKQLQKEKAELDAKVTEAQRQRPVPAPSAAPFPESDRVERLMRAANDCKVVVFTRGASTTSTEVCAKLRAAAGLPDYATAEAFKAGSVWFVKLISRTFTLTALQRWYAFKQLSGWGLDQALTKKQQDERSALKPRFLELKTAGAFPRWHGSEIFVRVQAGVRPATQWNPAQCVPPRPRANPAAAAPGAAATAPGAAAAPTAAGPRPTAPTGVRNPSPARAGVSPAAAPGSSAAAGPSAATAAAGTAGAGPAAPTAAGASGSSAPTANGPSPLPLELPLLRPLRRSQSWLEGVDSPQ